MPNAATQSLGDFLRDRRERMAPADYGFGGGRRRTPGLRREEVAQRANISPTWYTWLEQGRGGAPSADVLDRIAAGMMLTEPEREHLFMLGLGHPPEPHYRGSEGVTPRLQRVLDAFGPVPAMVKTATWDVIAWNRAAIIVLTDYTAIPPSERNILRMMFGQSSVRAAQDDWESVARAVVASFKVGAARAGASADVEHLVEELSRTSPEFAAMWRDSVIPSHGSGIKRLRHPEIGPIELEFSEFAVDGRPDLAMVVYNPATDDSATRISDFIAARS